MFILGIETSCDETSASVLEIKRGRFNIISNIISSQINIHKKYGGVVPELAARKHTENIIPVIDKALSKLLLPDKGGKGGFNGSDIKFKKPDAVAVVCGPGLATSLMVGVETAKTLAWTWKVPLIPINHLEAHICANWLPHRFPPDKGGKGGFKGNEVKLKFDQCVANPNPKINTKFPSLCLLISGGHTELILIKDFKKYKIIGETVDDAVGEAFDKVAKLLNLPYPGGPNVAKLAQKSSPPTRGARGVNSFNSPLSQRGARGDLKFPRPLINSNDFNFSFSGLKTSVSQTVKNNQADDICASFQQAVIDVLINKTIKAAKKYKVKTIMLAGGVASNDELRKQMAEKIKSELPQTSFTFPDKQFCTDNAAMVAAAGYFHYDKKLKPYNLEKVDVNPNLKLGCL
ncbi:MAG: tRNA (adenosine(37)-N6)-threonylcarbamoyltransferase complex transferase subunit TsaD [bacterium]